MSYETLELVQNREQMFVTSSDFLAEMDFVLNIVDSLNFTQKSISANAGFQTLLWVNIFVYQFFGRFLPKKIQTLCNIDNNFPKFDVDYHTFRRTNIRLNIVMLFVEEHTRRTVDRSSFRHRIHIRRCRV